MYVEHGNGIVVTCGCLNGKKNNSIHPSLARKRTKENIKEKNITVLLSKIALCRAITVKVVTSLRVYKHPRVAPQSHGVSRLTLNYVGFLYSAFAVFVWLSGNYRESRTSRFTDQKSQENHSVAFRPPPRTPRARLWSVRLPQRVGLCGSGVLAGSPRTEQRKPERGDSTGSSSVPVRIAKLKHPFFRPFPVDLSANWVSTS